MVPYFINSKLSFSVVLLSLFFLNACASNRVVSSWSEPAYNKKIKKILVLGMANKESIKKIYEANMVQALREANINAEEAGTRIPAGTKTNQKAIKTALSKQGFDTVLVTRLISKRVESRYTADQFYNVPSPYYHGFYDYYFQVYPMVYSPGYLVKDRIVSLETNIYELKEGKLIWAVVSESINVSNIKKEVEVLSKEFIKQLKKDGLVNAA